MQKKVFEVQESWNYFQRNYADRNLKEEPLHPDILSLYEAVGITFEHAPSILEIGCSGANNLYQSFIKFKAKKGVGIEPSVKIVEHLKKTYNELEFVSSSGPFIDFPQDTFDLVIVRFVLHWVERNDFLQFIGEIFRVSSKYVIISDFSPAKPYSVNYHHAEGCRTFKIEPRPIIETSGIGKCVFSKMRNADDEYDAVNTCLYIKNKIDSVYPMFTKENLSK